MYGILNEILYKWYGKCTSSNIYPDEVLLQEEPIEIEKRLDKEELNEFEASNGWLESWKKTYSVREKGYVEKLMTFLPQPLRFGSSVYKKCVKDVNHKTY